MPARDTRERRLVTVLAAIQLVNVVDFIMVMPLGPDLAPDVGIPISRLGVVNASYAAAAAVAGIAGTMFLDRIRRRTALVACVVGLAVSTLAGALATSAGTLLASRVMAGAFGGPATSLAFALVADAIPAARRGRAIAALSLAVSIATVAGMPLVIELAACSTWRAPFVLVAAAGGLAAVVAWRWIPITAPAAPVPPHHAQARSWALRPAVLLSHLATCAGTAGAFVLMPNMPAFVQANMHLPREQLAAYYVAGGVASLAAARPVGRLVDRVGSARVAAVAVALGGAAVLVGFVAADPRVPVMLVFAVYMLGHTGRTIAQSTLASRAPSPALRGSFMSLQSTLQHASAGAAALASSLVLELEADGALVHMEQLACISIALSCVVPLLLARAEAEMQSPPRIRGEIGFVDPQPGIGARAGEIR